MVFYERWQFIDAMLRFDVRKQVDFIRLVLFGTRSCTLLLGAATFLLVFPFL